MFSDHCDVIARWVTKICLLQRKSLGNWEHARVWDLWKFIKYGTVYFGHTSFPKDLWFRWYSFVSHLAKPLTRGQSKNQTHGLKIKQLILANWPKEIGSFSKWPASALDWVLTTALRLGSISLQRARRDNSPFWKVDKQPLLLFWIRHRIDKH